MFKESKPDSPPNERENCIIVQTTSQNAAMDICLISTRLSSSTVKEAIFCVKQKKVLVPKNTINDPSSSVVSGKED